MPIAPKLPASNPEDVPDPSTAPTPASSPEDDTRAYTDSSPSLPDTSPTPPKQLADTKQAALALVVPLAERGLGPYASARFLNTLGFRTPAHGRPWAGQSIYKLLDEHRPDLLEGRRRRPRVR